MNKIADYIASGILELYVLNALQPNEAREVEIWAAKYPAIQIELDKIRSTMQEWTSPAHVVPSPSVKPLLFAQIDYQERLNTGEQFSMPPLLGNQSSIADYAAWLNRPDMAIPADFKECHIKIIGQSLGVTTSIIWISRGLPKEIHHTEKEKFLVVEGTCLFYLGSDEYPLQPGDFFDVPLHTEHKMRVTSPSPCKAILERCIV